MLGTGCASEVPRSLGNLERGLPAREEAFRAGSRNAMDGELSGVSEWDVLRRASTPEWARDGALRKDGPERAETGPENPEPAESGTPDASQGSPKEATLALVDREHGLSPEYEPEDLAFLQPLEIPTLGGGSMKLQKEAAESASGMFADARAAGYDLVVCSAYRSYEAQVISYGRLTAVYGEGAGGLSAPPGHSEHQLGTVIDISNASMDYQLHQRFAETEAARWLRRNAAEYGFVLSYPREAEEHTGYRWEPWHYRYIGRENALRYSRGEYRSPQQFFREQAFPES